MLAKLCAQYIVVLLALDGDEGAVLAERYRDGVHGRWMRAAEQRDIRLYTDGEGTSQTDVLTHIADGQGRMIAQSLAIGRCQHLQSVHVEYSALHLVLKSLSLGVTQYRRYHSLRKAVEFLVASHKVSLTIDLHQSCVILIHCYCDKTLLGATTLQLGCLGPPVLLCLFPQPMFSLKQGESKRFPCRLRSCA